MSGLLYREDMDEVRRRLKTWWDGGEIGRPVLKVTAPRERPLEEIPPIERPAGWVTDYSTRSLEYRIYLSKIACVRTWYLGEAVPAVAPDLAPNCLALYLGCKGVERPGTVWCEPCIETPEQAKFVFDKSNFYWQFTERLGRAQLEEGSGKFLVAFPDLIEGLDTLAAMRGTEPLLVDLVERPDWVRSALRQITDRYFHAYDILYDMFRDELGGSVFWAWAPGRMAKFQCDLSAMISPAMFGEFMVPVLAEMSERVSYCMYHWDGPGAIRHHELLLSIPGIEVLQWTPGAGVEPPAHRRWWPLYHRTIEAGKRVYIWCERAADVLELKREFGPRLSRFMIDVAVPSRAEGEELLKAAEV